MQERDLDHTIEALQQQIAQVHRCAAEDSGQLADMMAETLQGLVNIVGELRAAQENLRQWKDELSAARREVEASHRRYQSLFESIPHGCLMTDSAGIIKEANQTALDLFSTERECLIGKPLLDLITAKSCHQAFGGNRVPDLEKVHKAQDFKVRLKPLGRPDFPAVIRAVALPSAQSGAPDDLCWLIRSLAEGRRIDEGRRAREELYYNFFEEDLTGEFISTPDGQILACNPAFARIFGFASVEEAMSCNLDTLYPNHQAREAYLELIRKEKKIECHETELRRRDGQPVQLIEKALGTFDDQGRLVEIQGYVFDITDRKLLEEQLRQSQKMEAVRRLANRVAHDFNNLLVGVKGYSELLLYHIDSQDPLRKDIEEIRKAGELAAALTHKLLTFSRKTTSQHPVVIDLKAAVASLDGKLRTLISEGIDLTYICDPGPSLIKADPGQIGQVLTNLITNAREAMPQGGKITVTIANVHLDESYARQHVGVQAGPYVMLAVADSGIGMDEETLSHVFEPFYTTKKQGKERGLGLATVYGIIEQCGGHISISSRLAEGTTIKIYLPVIQESKTCRTGTGGLAGLGQQAARKGMETLLLVEDEESVRTAIGMILRKFGYTVLEAHQGEEAMIICEQYQGPIHLMLTDMVMPRMSGLDLARRLRPYRPEMKVIFMSGNLGVIYDQQNSSEPNLNLLSKPFVLGDLVHRVRQVLDEK
ncbi:MAG: ATP-binding protein [bacterium]